MQNKSAASPSDPRLCAGGPPCPPLQGCGALLGFSTSHPRGHLLQILASGTKHGYFLGDVNCATFPYKHIPVEARSEFSPFYF